MKRPPMTAMDVLRVSILILLYPIMLPLQFVFYLLRSAWMDSADIGRWLRRSYICEHGIDRVRLPCDVCMEAEERQVLAAMQQGREN